MFARRKREMPERNRVQAYFPAGSEPIANPYGTAPGIWQRIDDTVVIAMPGVPSEMKAMFLEQVQPRLERLGLAGGAVQLSRKLNTFGSGESHVEQHVSDLTRRGHVPEVGITASDATISLRIFARAAHRQEALMQLESTEAVIRERLGKLVYGADDEELQHAVVRLLAARRQSLATAESITCGLVARRLGEVPGASEWFHGGIVAYTNRVKAEVLGVPQSLLDEFGAVSAQVVEAMAAGCRARLHTDLAVSTSGLAGPGGALPDKPVGLVYVALAWQGGVRSAAHNWSGTRLEIQSRTAKMALNLVRLHLH
jgi:nicotinamide-nucleotide amidase